MKRNSIPLNERIIFALDVPTAEQAIELVDRLDGQITSFKVGMQLFFASGWKVVDHIAARGGKVMLDLKLYDIPATVRLAFEQFAGRGVHLATVHGYTPVVEAALEAKTEVQVLAVTVLTSFGEQQLQELNYQGTIEDLVFERANRVIGTGCHGVVCSAQEASMLRSKITSDFLMVTPGIRPSGSDKGDQQRIATPGQAIADGADYLVIGRPIRDAENPGQMIASISKEIEMALSR
ncbi:orotidine-5'-phosphate decarboxylase [Desulfogranum japonicum]|uniref:orotidine-5'-phosphate decarboxylase n=1 Tax=Desulfogranum japonicum TaxID=231447 RepID=UPI000406429C|nr:orotidine-5'-phosphate decarboxylase [Desulfogranum japonicum]